MSQSAQTRQSDYVACPTTSGDNRTRTPIAVTNVASATDLHAQGVVAGHYCTFINDGAATAYVVFDSVSTGTAATVNGGIPIPANGGSVNFLLKPASGTTYPTYANRYLKAITAGGNTTIRWYMSTSPGIGGQ